MRSVEITRSGALSVADHLADMQRWLNHAGNPATDLHAARILGGRVTFTATFRQAADADRFLRAFGD
jgi:hypothetical protein